MEEILDTIGELPGVGDIANGASELGGTVISYVGMDFLQIAVGLLLIYISIKWLGQAIGKMSIFFVLIAAYLILRGVVDLSSLTNVLEEVPEIIEKFLMIGREAAEESGISINTPTT